MTPNYVEDWPPVKKALWKVLMDENLNDGHYIKAFVLIDKLYDATLFTPMLPCPVFGGEAIHAIDTLKRIVINPIQESDVIDSLLNAAERK